MRLLDGLGGWIGGWPPGENKIGAPCRTTDGVYHLAFARPSDGACCRNRAISDRLGSPGITREILDPACFTSRALSSFLCSFTKALGSNLFLRRAHYYYCVPRDKRLLRSGHQIVGGERSVVHTSHLPDFRRRRNPCAILLRQSANVLTSLNERNRMAGVASETKFCDLPASFQKNDN